jgi:phosphoribosylformylglycinamidine (FGAM) synthase-like enzyme
MTEAATKLVTAGADRLEIVLCDNFYTPRVTPEIAWALKSMVDAICSLSIELGMPFVSGKDSSSGTFVGEDGVRIDAPPTLAVLAMGRMPDATRLVSKFFGKPGNRIFLVGPLSASLGGSIFLDTLGLRGSEPPSFSSAELIAGWESIQSLRKAGWIQSASAVGEGGLVRRAFEASGGALGCRIDLGPLSRRLKPDQPETLLFAEMAGAALVEIEPKHAADLESRFNAVPVGEVTAEPVLAVSGGGGDFTLALDELVRVWSKPFAEVVR